MVTTMDVSFSPAGGGVAARDAAPAQLSLTGRYMLLESGCEYDCRTQEISPDAVSLFAPVVSRPGAQVVLYLDDLGRFAGAISGVTQIGFEMRLRLTPRRRARLASQLAWRAGGAENSGDPTSHELIEPDNAIAILRRSNGREHFVRIRGLSVSRVVLETDQRVLTGEAILVGATPAKVVGIHDGQVACEFLRPFEQIDPSTRL